MNSKLYSVFATTVLLTAGMALPAFADAEAELSARAGLSSITDSNSNFNSESNPNPDPVPDANLFPDAHPVPSVSAELGGTPLTPMIPVFDATATKPPLRNPEAATVSLPENGIYSIVDPLTGLIKGPFDPTLSLQTLSTFPSGLLIVDKNTGSLVATVIDGQLLDISSACAIPELVSSIDSRTSELNRIISDAIASGITDAAGVAIVRARLDNIANEHLSFKASGVSYTYSDALALAHKLNRVSQDIQSLTQTEHIAPVIGPKLLVIDNAIVYADDIDYRIVSMRNRIEDEYRAGRLSSRQVLVLKERLTEISSLQNKYKKGDLTEAKLHLLSNKLDQVNSLIAQDIAFVNQRRAALTTIVY